MAVAAAEAADGQAVDSAAGEEAEAQVIPSFATIPIYNHTYTAHLLICFSCDPTYQ